MNTGSNDVTGIINKIREQAVREFAEKLKESFNKLEYVANTHRKTLDLDVVKNQIDWVLHEVTTKEIDKLAKEFVKDINVRTNPEEPKGEENDIQRKNNFS